MSLSFSFPGYSGACTTTCSVRHTMMTLYGGLILIIATLFNAAAGTIATTDNVIAAQTKTPSHPFMNVETSCSGDSLLIMASLQEPFFGLIYANGFATSPSCRAEGTGNRLLRLALNASECGIHFIQTEDGSRQLELSLYLQYDYHVQQAVDEKMTTRCRLQTTEKSSTESPVTQPSSLQQRHSAIFSLLEKSSRRNEAGPPATTIKNALLPFRTLMNNSLTPTTSAPGKLSSLPLTSYQAKKLEMNRDSKIPSSSSPSMISSGALKLLPAPKQRDAITCWMDIVAGTDPTGNPVESYLRVGQEATVVVRVRQTVGLDTRLTSCVAHDGSHESQQELLDSDGCSLDTSILPNVQERIINRSGSVIKLLYANFQAFRFPDRDHLHLKCTVVVCKGKCLMNPCNLIRRKGRATNSSKVMEGKGFGQLGSIRQLSAQEMSESATRPSRLRHIDRSLSSSSDSKSRLRSGSLRSSNLTMAINSIPNYGAVIDKVDVFNSVEIRVSTPSKNTDDAIRGYTSKSISDEDFSDGSSEEAIFCLTPSKLFMAFGILFAVLISAMLFAVCVCIRIKTSKNHQQKNQQQQQQQQQRHNPYSASSPPRFLSSSPCPPTQNYNPACIRHPGSFNGRHQLQLNFNRQNSAAPYMRVFK
uniref:ZP domain-containing protein n=1 Tax=Daphnia galeata TaxID=27404 RepID=A0A8J2RIA9_9CRUS|nr:unnamed protein product [Daphnia galeata]